MNTIQQLEDLKEWSQDSARYERRLAFRGSMGTQAGTIPPEWDDLSDREREYYRTGPWSTREDYRKGQLVQPGPGRQGYQGNPSFGKEITGKMHEGKIFGKNKERLNKLKEIIQESNSSYTKNITAHEALVKAGWKDGYQSIGTTQKIRPEVAKSMKKLLTTQNKIDNYINNVMLAEDALVKDFRSPQHHIAKKFGVSKSFMDKWAADSKIYQENKKLFTGLRNELSFNKYKTLPDGAPRLIADYSEIIQNKLPTAFGDKSLPHTFIMDSAHRHNTYAKHAGKSSQVRFIDKNYELLPRSEWKFIKNNKLYSMDAALDDVVYQGKAYKNNYLNHADAAKLYKNDFGEVYKVFDDLDTYMNTMVDGPDGKPIKLDTLLRRQAYDETGKKDFLKRRFAEIDHFDIDKKPFSDIRLLDRQTNVRAGILKRFDKYKNNPKLLNKTLTDIGYLNRDKDSAAFIKRMTKKAGVIPKFKPKISGGQALHSFPANIPAMWKRLGHGTKRILGWGTALLFEKAFYDWDRKNEISKGKTEEEATGIALNNATFGIMPNKKYLPELKKVAKDMGINPQAFEKVYFLNEKMADVQKQDAQYQQRIEMIKKMPGDPERKARALADMEEAYANWQKGMTSQIGKWSEDVAGQIAISKTKLPKPSLDQIAEERYNITDEDWMKPFAEIQMVGEEKLRREKDRAYDVQSKLADPESGSGYKWITNWFTPSENFFDLRTTGQEKQRLIDDMVRFDPKELYRYNLYERGISPDSPVSKEALENLQYEHGAGLGLREERAGGGIAGIRRPWAIPPESGPMPQGGGLSSQFNRVRKLTG